MNFVILLIMDLLLEYLITYICFYAMRKDKDDPVFKNAMTFGANLLIQGFLVSICCNHAGSEMFIPAVAAIGSSLFISIVFMIWLTVAELKKLRQKKSKELIR